MVATFLLIIAGGLVTSTESGLAVPDWPLSYGMWMPPMVGGIFYEHGHRMIASLVGLITLFLTVWLGFVEKRAWVRWACVAALGMVVLQGILGGLTVLYLLPAPISIFHGCLAQTFFAFTICLAYFTSREWHTEATQQVASANDLQKMVWLTMALIYLQLILGATFRHTENRFILIPHIACAFLVVLQVAAMFVSVTRTVPEENKIIHPAMWLGVITVFQLFLGMGAFIYKVMLKDLSSAQLGGKVFFVTAHQTLGALFLGVSVFLMLRIYRLLKVT